jgi:hypothetical protein
VTFVGSPTNGANGDVTSTVLPGGIVVNFTGHDVRHADGRQLQRVGIQPHIHVEPTIEGIQQGRDEVLEAALSFLGENFILQQELKENYMSGMSEEERDQLKDSDFAFPKERKEPINDAEHVRAAVARFDQVEGVTNKERDEAWERIVKAAKKYGVDLDENDWRELYRRNGRQVPKE